MEILKLDNVDGIAEGWSMTTYMSWEAIRKLSADSSARKKAGCRRGRMSSSGSLSWQELKKNSDGMVPVIVQDCRTDAVLMQAYMDRKPTRPPYAPEK